MPSKRQPSKQRRAAQNRAQRAALAARREHASREAATAASAGSTATRSGKAPARGARAARGRPTRNATDGMFGGFLRTTMGDAADQPGAWGVLLSVPFAIAAAVYLLAFFKIDVDDRGKQLPLGGRDGFRGLYLATRETLTGHDVAVGRELGLDAVGPAWLLLTIVPLLVVLAVFFLFRFRRQPSMYWTVTIGMLLIAASVLLLGRIEYVGSMAMLTWASFQIRKTELPGKLAERDAVRAARAEEAAARKAKKKAADEDDEDAYEAYEEEAYEREAYEEEDGDESDGTDDDTDAEDAYEEYDEAESEYDEAEDESEYEDEDVAEVEEDEEPEAVEPEPAPAPAPTAPSTSDDDRIVDYDEDILKELEAEIDERERRGGDTGPGR